MIFEGAEPFDEEQKAKLLQARSQRRNNSRFYIERYIVRINEKDTKMYVLMNMSSKHILYEELRKSFTRTPHLRLISNEAGAELCSLELELPRLSFPRWGKHCHSYGTTTGVPGNRHL